MIGGIDKLRIPNLSCCEPICGAFLRTLVRLTADARRLTIISHHFLVVQTINNDGVGTCIITPTQQS